MIAVSRAPYMLQIGVASGCTMSRLVLPGLAAREIIGGEAIMVTTVVCFLQLLMVLGDMQSEWTIAQCVHRFKG